MAALPRVRSLAVLTAVALLAATACEDHPHSVVTTSVRQAPVPGGPPAAEAVVSAGPDGLRLRGQPWWPSGFNGPQLATDYSINFGCGAEVDLDAFFAEVPEHSLTRFGLFQAFALDKQSGELDFRAADRVFAAAEKHGRLILPVLTDQAGQCGDEIFKQREWYIDGWKKSNRILGRTIMSFQDWVRTAISRWRGSPVLAGWELVGEPEVSKCNRGGCELRHRTCPGDAPQVLRHFMDEAGELVRGLDPHRLIFAGFVGGSQCGIARDAFRYVSESAGIDVVEYHDYSEDGNPLPGGPNNGLARRITLARQIGKPLLVAELGEYAGSCESLEDRRDIVDRRITGQRAAGTAGALIWAYVPDPRPDECTYDVGPQDPLWELVAAKTTLG
ncbi:beta-mannosidase [Nocardia yamanashiensis]|uniref:beta-mannosidase n=1 Tax=Nocardia yamanashiensis TaxID=209247 RepID=UPI001E65C5E6|nr:beta-mannosidase [Nocardia yamanashiensis]UGT41070.1 beta-mannosidase [Nocardia yamanashiensis]